MGDQWRQAFVGYGNSSFTDLLRQTSPHLFPGSVEPDPEPSGRLPAVPHGTTVLALRYRDGVVMAGDRQASEGYQVAHRHIEKIFKLSLIHI